LDILQWVEKFNDEKPEVSLVDIPANLIPFFEVKSLEGDKIEMKQVLKKILVPLEGEKAFMETIGDAEEKKDEILALYRLFNGDAEKVQKSLDASAVEPVTEPVVEPETEPVTAPETVVEPVVEPEPVVAVEPVPEGSDKALASLPESVRKALADLDGYKEREKEQDIASKFEGIETLDIPEVVSKLKSLDPGIVDYIASKFKALNTLAKGSDVLGEIGRNQESNQSSNIEAKIKSLRDINPGLSYSQAYSKALDVETYRLIQGETK